jgi:hypothetical protein
MGVDRISDWTFAFGNVVVPGAIFSGADRLWNSMQGNMINYINAHGGHAEFYGKKSYIARPDYNLVQDYLDGKITLPQLKAKIGC